MVWVHLHRSRSLRRHGRAWPGHPLDAPAHRRDRVGPRVEPGGDAV